MDATTAQSTVGPPGWRAPANLSELRVHMIGVGGSGMAGLAALLLRHGAQVSGADRVASPTLTRLSERGARIFAGQSLDDLPSDVDLVVASAAAPADHAQVIEARRRGLAVMKYAELLGLVMDRHTGIAVAGTHGKSTTTAWIAYTLGVAGLGPSFVVGAECEQLGGGSGVGAGRHFVAEACEYDHSFLNLRPSTAIILNIEEDHLDFYRDLDDIRSAFERFALGVPKGGLVIVNGDDPSCLALAEKLDVDFETFGLSEGCDWQAGNLRVRDGRYELLITHLDEPLGEVHLGLAGKHNVMNALAVCAAARHAQAPWPVVRGALNTFRGAKRRLELRAEVGGVTIVDDYAHHPTEIRATLAAARERFRPRRLWVVFQPHQHSRTRFLMQDFADSFAAADFTIVPRIYFVRDTERDRERVSAADLAEEIRRRGQSAEHIDEFPAIVNSLAPRLRAGDLVLTMGAGDIWKVADDLVQWLREHLPG